MNISGIGRVSTLTTMRETVKKVTGGEHVKKATPEEGGENRQQEVAALKKAILSQWPMMAYDGVELNQSRTHKYSAGVQ